jgi:hypothetical protein
LNFVFEIECPREQYNRRGVERSEWLQILMVGVGGHGDMSNDYAVVYAYFGSKTN